MNTRSAFMNKISTLMGPDKYELMFHRVDKEDFPGGTASKVVAQYTCLYDPKTYNIMIVWHNQEDCQHLSLGMMPIYHVTWEARVEYCVKAYEKWRNTPEEKPQQFVSADTR